MPITTRLLGLAFASADALVEIDAQGRVGFALGAGPAAGQDVGALWTGKPLTELLHQGDHVLQTLMNSKAGARSAPLQILLTAGADRVRRASIRAFVLPQLAPAISCAIAYEGPAIPLGELDVPPLIDAERFLIDAPRIIDNSRDLAFGFLDVHGLEQLPEALADRVQRRIEATLQSAAVHGSSAAQITQERFALLRPETDKRDLAAEVVEAGRAEGAELAAESFTAPVPQGADSLCVLRAMRFAIEGCLKDGGLANPQIAFTESLKRTFRDAEAFRGVVKARDFQVHYQPIVRLDSRAVHHFEALARFNTPNGPAEAIRMAEELKMIEAFDLAVAEKVLKRMRAPGAGLLKMAINVSGASLGDDTYVENLLKMTSGSTEERKRLIVEVTETSALADLEAANRRLTALRETGIKVCIDDFGAGATSYDYVRKLPVDAVKIDGDLVGGLGDPMTQGLIRGFVDLCRSMKLETIAEMIETDQVADQLKALGVEYGQGWLFGRAEAEPRTQLASAAPIRRRGAVEAWG